MSWYTDPQLFISGSFNYVFRVTKDSGINPFLLSDLSQESEQLNFSKHLSLGNNELRDYDAFKAYCFPKSGNICKLINSQGLVIIINYDTSIKKGIWSMEEPSSPFWKLPGITRPKSDAEKVSDLEAMISSLRGDVERNKVEKEAADKRVSDLEAQNDNLRGNLDRNKVQKEAVDKRVTDLEAENSELRGRVDTVDKRVMHLEAQNANLLGNLDSNKVEKTAVDKRVVDLEAQNANLRDEVDRNKVEKTALDKRLNDLETQNAIFRALEKQVNRKSDGINADMLARLTSLEKLVVDLSSKLAQCFVAGDGGSSIEEPWVTVDAD